jgi:CrcB protein
MRNLILVGGGGFLGSVARYYVTGWATQLTTVGRFTLGTLVVNVTGCFLIGLLAGLAEHAHVLSGPSRLFLLTGFLGGFTTYSAFAYRTYFLGREQLAVAAFANVALQVLLGLGAVLVGARVAAKVAAKVAAMLAG